MVRQCRRKKKCQICKKPHATVLHHDSRATSKNDQATQNTQAPNDESTNVSSNCVSTCHVSVTTLTSSLIVPVWLHHQSDPERKRMVYAVPDDQSDACFVTD